MSGEERSVASREREKVSLRRLLWVAPAAAVAAALANSFVYLVSSVVGAIPEDVTVGSSGAPITLVPVIVSSVVGVLGAAAVLALLAWFSGRPARIFIIVSVVVLVLSFVTPFSISGAPVEMIVALLVMHVVAWAVAVTLLLRLSVSGAS